MFISRGKLFLVLLAFQVLYLVLFVLFVDYDKTADASYKPNSRDVGKGGVSPATNEMASVYTMFTDVHVMIFFGIAYLLTFLKRHGYSSVGFNLLFGMFAAQWWFLISGFIHGLHDGKIHLNISSLLFGDFAAAVVLITYCVVLGKVSPLQMFILCFLETACYAVCEYVGYSILQVADIGGSMFIHAFACYFGLAVTRVIHKKGTLHSPKEGAIYHSDLFSFAGTVFLWIFWPSFNSCLAAGDARHRAILNTYLSLAGCCLATMATSSVIHKNGKFDMVHLENASLAGGVVMGAIADFMIMPWGAVLLGILAGVISTLGFTFATPWMADKLKIQDVCGVQNLHGFPAILSTIASAIHVAMATPEQYGNSLYTLFPAMAPPANSTELREIQAEYSVVEAGKGRTAAEQAGYQMLGLAVTLGISIVGGLITGLLLRLPYLDEPTGDDLYDDKAWWVVNPFLDEEVPANDSSPSVAADVDAAEMKKFTAISEA